MITDRSAPAICSSPGRGDSSTLIYSPVPISRPFSKKVSPRWTKQFRHSARHFSFGRRVAGAPLSQYSQVIRYPVPEYTGYTGYPGTPYQAWAQSLRVRLALGHSDTTMAEPDLRPVSLQSTCKTRLLYKMPTYSNILVHQPADAHTIHMLTYSL